MPNLSGRSKHAYFVQAHLIKQLISYLVVTDVAFIPQEYYYHRSPRPSTRSFLAETPTDIWSGCDWLVGEAEEEDGPYMGAVGHPTQCFNPVPLASPWQWDGGGGWAAHALGRSPILQQYKASLLVQQTHIVLHVLIVPPQGQLLLSRSRPATGLFR